MAEKTNKYKVTAREGFCNATEGVYYPCGSVVELSEAFAEHLNAAGVSVELITEKKSNDGK